MFDIRIKRVEAMTSIVSGNILTKAKDELKSLLGIALYFWVLFTLFAFHKAILNHDHDILLQLGIALINSKLMAKVVFLGERTRLNKRFDSKPLLYTILFKSFVFAIILFFFRVLEEILIGVWNGRTIYDALVTDHPGVTDGSAVIVTAMVCTIMFVALIPFFAYMEIEDALGPETLRNLLFRKPLGAFKQTENIRSTVSTSSPVNYSGEFDNYPQWFYEISGQIVGPLTKDQCQNALLNGTIDTSTLVWKESFADSWIPLRQLLQII